MKDSLISNIKSTNPWLSQKSDGEIQLVENFIERIQLDKLLLSEWDKLCTIIIGPRRAGKTTIGYAICKQLIKIGRFENLLYLNCDYLTVRDWLRDPNFVYEAIDYLKTDKLIIFIDEAQRLESPGLLLKSLIDLNLPVKFIASGSSQLEMKSKVMEHLTGRQIESLILPLSYREITQSNLEEIVEDIIIYGCYPQIIRTKVKNILLKQLYEDYLRKDIVEYLKIGNPDSFEKTISLLAHNCGQLVNYSNLATDCQVPIAKVKHFIEILEKTFILFKVTPFVGNKRTEITSNPIYHFIDNGFRNNALNNFNRLENRTDAGFLVQNSVIQEIYKYKVQSFKNFTIHFWRTKGGAEVDIILRENFNTVIPIEVKYRTIERPSLSKSFRSFIAAYKPKIGFYITKDYNDKTEVDGCLVYFISMKNLNKLLEHLDNITS